MIIKKLLIQWIRRSHSLFVIAFLPSLLMFVVLAIAGASFGAWMTSVPDVARRVVPFSGSVLALIAVIWIWPEVAGTFGWTTGSALILAGFGTLWAINRFVYPVCPSCSHTHDHDVCSSRLHGFATPLIAATLIHSLFDGWVFGTAQESANAGQALTVGIWLHRLPESIAFGVILKAALASRRRAIIWAIAAQVALLSGTALALISAPYLGMRWITLLLAIGGGTFLYLGYHAVEAEWRVPRLARTRSGAQ